MFPTNFREITLQSYLQSDQVCQTSVEKNFDSFNAKTLAIKRNGLRI